ncbi:10671_t:CDS:2, partial [Paraglomus occultum]
MAENYTLAGIFGHHEEWKSQLVKDIQTIYDLSDTSDIPKVLKDLKKFYNEKEGCDVNIIVGNDPDTKAFLAHSFILKARSEYFRTALSATWVKKENGMIIFRKPNISSQIFELILRYLYTAEIFKSNLDLPVAFDLMTAADELGLTLLVDTIQRRIIIQSPLWEKRFFFTVFQASSSNPHLTLLYQHSLSKLLACRNVFIKSDDIDALTADTMLGILQEDDIDVDELNLWKAVMTWAHKKIPNISTEPNDWSDEEIDCMKNLLHDIITHIHFVDLTTTECNGIIEKYKKILPEGIVDALKEYHESPSKTIHQDLHHPYVHCLSPRRYVRSLILTRRQGHCLLNSIREFDQDCQPEYIPSVLALLERGTNFGFSTHNIQAVMNRTGQKVLVMKVKD